MLGNTDVSLICLLKMVLPRIFTEFYRNRFCLVGFLFFAFNDDPGSPVRPPLCVVLRVLDRSSVCCKLFRVERSFKLPSRISPLEIRKAGDLNGRDLLWKL